MSIESGRRVLAEEAAAVAKCGELLDDSFVAAVELVFHCKGRTITCGVGKSGHIARKMAGTLSSTGTPSLFLHASEAVHGDLGMVTSDDVVILYTHSGETDELVKLFPSIRGIGAKAIVITGRRDSSAGRLADLTLSTHVGVEACSNNLAPTTSTTVMLALSDALAIAVMDRRNFSKEDFARFHPSGTLGKRLLLRVSDAMHAFPDIAVASLESSILDVMQAITKAGVGAACIVDENRSLIGVISDGDLRRHFVTAERPFEATAAAILNRNPSTITPDLLAVEALEIFQNHPRKLGDLPVIENGKVVGLLLLKDLLRIGIV